MMKWAALAPTVAVLLAGCVSPGERDRRNRDLLESLPLPETATLIKQRITQASDIRVLHYLYATDLTDAGVWDFYGAALAAAGWSVDMPHDEVHGTWHGERGSVLVDVFPGQQPDRPNATVVALPPPGTLTYFEVSAGASR